MKNNSALEKRIKRQIIGKPHRFLAVVPLGFEDTLIRELQAIGIETVAGNFATDESGTAVSPENFRPHTVGDGKVEFTAKIAEAWKAVAYSRIANRILMHIADFKAENFRELEKKAAEIPWELYLNERTAQKGLQTSRLQVERRDGVLAYRHDRDTAPDAEGVNDERIVAGHAAFSAAPAPCNLKPDPCILDERRVTNRLQVERRDGVLAYRHDRDTAPDAEGVNDERFVARQAAFSAAPAPCNLKPDPCIHVTCKHSRLYHSDAVAERLQKVIERQAETFLYLKASETSDLEPQASNLFVTLIDDRCTLWLDLAGEELYRRGHERFVNDAPLKETIAAAMLQEAFDATALTTNHQPPITLFDPMAGSGTFSLEAAYAANGLIPGTCRDFALKHQPAFKEATWNYMIRGVTSDESGQYLGLCPLVRMATLVGRERKYSISLSETKEPAESCKTFATIAKIITSDISERAVNIIKHNIECSPLASIAPNAIDPKIRDFFSYTAKEIAELCGESAPVIVLNPPYGKRLDFNAPKLYTRIGKKLSEIARELRPLGKVLTVAILAPKDDTRPGSRYTCTANLLQECPALNPQQNPDAKCIVTSHGGFSLNTFIARI